MRQLKILKGLGLLVGMIIGAGMFALPYAVSRAGLWWGSFHFVLAAVLVTSVHLLYGKVLFHNHLRHRLPGYMREYMGESAYWITLVSRLFAYFGYLLAYGALAGLLLNNFIPTVSPGALSITFFLIISLFVLLKLSGVSMISLVLNIFLIIFIGFLYFALFPKIHYDLALLRGDAGAWFFPYGIFLFAFGGASIIPEVVDLFGHGGEKRFRLVVLASTGIVAIVYTMFIATVLGIAQGGVAQDGLSSLERFGGDGFLLLGSFIGLLAIIDSYIGLGLELQTTFRYDLGVGKNMARVFVVMVPLALYALGINNFVLILAVTGAVGIGIEGICIATLARKTLGTDVVLVTLLSAAFIVGAVFGIVQTLVL